MSYPLSKDPSDRSPSSPSSSTFAGASRAVPDCITAESRWFRHYMETNGASTEVCQLEQRLAALSQKASPGGHLPAPEDDPSGTTVGMCLSEAAPSAADMTMCATSIIQPVCWSSATAGFDDVIDGACVPGSAFSAMMNDERIEAPEPFNTVCVNRAGIVRSPGLGTAADSCSSVYHEIMHSLGLPSGNSEDLAALSSPVAAAPVVASSAPHPSTGRLSRAKRSSDSRKMATVAGKSRGAVSLAGRQSQSANSRPASQSRDPVASRRPTNGKGPLPSLSSVKDDVTQRYLAFIDELIREKQDLATRYEAMAAQVASLQDRHQRQVNSMKEQHKDQIQAVKRGLVETEKTKRQKWMDVEKEKIKESTARGMQTQIEQMVRQHGEELARMREFYERQLTVAGVTSPPSAGRPQLVGGLAGDEQLRSRLLLERDDALQQVNQRHERRLGEVSSEYETRVQQLTAEVQQLRNQLQSAEGAAVAERQHAQRELERRVSEMKDRLTEESRTERRQLENDIQTSERDLRDKLRTEMEISLERQRQELELSANAKLQSEVQRLKEERDARVEEVVARLEQEIRYAEESEAQRCADKLKKLEEKHQLDVKALEAAEERFKGKYLDARSRLAERDEDLLDLRARLHRKESEIGEMKQTAELLHREQQQLGDVIEAEFRQQLSELRTAAGRWQQRLTETEQRHAGQMSEARHRLAASQQQRRTELEALHKQIKEAFASKEQKCEDLVASLQLSQKKVKQLENLLDKMQMVGCRCANTTV